MCIYMYIYVYICVYIYIYVYIYICILGEGGRGNTDWIFNQRSLRVAWVCGRSLAGIAGFNPAGVMDVCLF